MPSVEPAPEWERVLSAAAHLQRILTDAVLAGGTAAAIHARQARRAAATTRRGYLSPASARIAASAARPLSVSA